MDDLISRQQTIDVIRAMQTYKLFAGDDLILVDKAGVMTELMMLPSAQPYTAEEIQKMQELEFAQVEKAYELGRESAQPEPHWIPVSERMPEEHEWIGTKKFGTTMSDEVYVTFENSKGERFTKHLHFHNGELSRYDKTHMDAWFKDYKPIAWMPLPEPYKEGETT